MEKGAPRRWELQSVAFSRMKVGHVGRLRRKRGGKTRMAIPRYYLSRQKKTFRIRRPTYLFPWVFSPPSPSRLPPASPLLLGNLFVDQQNQTNELLNVDAGKKFVELHTRYDQPCFVSVTLSLKNYSAYRSPTYLSCVNWPYTEGEIKVCMSC